MEEYGNFKSFNIEEKPSCFKVIHGGWVIYEKPNFKGKCLYFYEGRRTQYARLHFNDIFIGAELFFNFPSTCSTFVKQPRCCCQSRPTSHKSLNKYDRKLETMQLLS